MKTDAVGGQELLLFPEAALALNDTAAAIVRLCDGTRTVGAIIDAIARTYTARDVGAIGDEVCAFLNTMRERGLLE